MVGGVVAPRELVNLRDFFTTFDGHGRDQSGTGGAGDAGPDCNGIFSHMEFSVEKFFTYNRNRHSICMGNRKKLFLLSSDEQLPIQEELTLRRIPWFAINHLSLISGTEESLALWGSKGIMIVKLNCEIAEESSPRESFIAESVYRAHPNLSIAQCRWVPIVGYKILVVLNSDCFLRVYNTDTGESLGCFNLGPSDSLPLVTKFSPEINPETPVDFDFGPYITSSKSLTLFTLKPTGNISYALLGVMGTNIRCMLNAYKSLKIYEGSEISFRDEDNYSRILCSKQFPTVIVVGQDDGRLTHSIMLPHNVEVDYNDEEDMERQLFAGHFSLFTRERLSLSTTGNSLTTSMLLRLDPIFDERYFCVNESGVHLITMKFLPEIIRYLSTDEGSLSALTPSNCQLLLLWKVGPKSQSMNKIVGVSMTINQPWRLICVLHDYRTVAYSLPHPCDQEFALNQVPSYDEVDSGAPVASFPVDTVPKPVTSSSSKSFITKAQQILKPAEQPFYCSDQRIPNNEQKNLLINSITLKVDQLAAMEKGMQFVLGYLDSLSAKSSELKKWLSRIIATRKGLKEEAEKIAETYETRCDYDEVVKKRMDAILFRFHQDCPVLTEKEQVLQETLDEINNEMQFIKLSLDVLNEKMAEFEEREKNDIELKSAQVQQIQDEIIHQQFQMAAISETVQQILSVARTY